MCSVEDCDKVVHLKSLCQTHYGRLHRSTKDRKDYFLGRTAEKSEYDRKRYLENREAVINKSKNWYQENKDKKSEYDKEYRPKWRKENPEANRAILSRRRQQGGVHMSDADKTDSVAWRKIIKDRPCAWCGEFSDYMHDDHIQPLSRSGTDHCWNLVRSCAKCNMSKGPKTGAEFIAYRTGKP